MTKKEQWKKYSDVGREKWLRLKAKITSEEMRSAKMARLREHDAAYEREFPECSGNRSVRGRVPMGWKAGRI